MLFDFFADLNWLAVIVAGLAYFVLGAVWYSDALMGKQYRAAIGQEEGSPVNVPAIVVNLVGWLVAAVALALIAKAAGADDFLDGIVLGLVAWVGFIATNRTVGNYYEGSGWAPARINGPYNALGYMVMGVILALWQ
jgi:hypothetical protein